jgi:hypothetical protein
VRTLLAWMPNFWISRISTLGVALTTLSGFVLLMALAATVFGGGFNVYVTAVLFLVMPGIFVLGLILIPFGIVRKRRLDAKAGVPSPPDEKRPFTNLFRDKTARRNIVFLGAATFVNLLLIGGAGQKALSFMETPEFCGTVCHTIMQPEYEAHGRSPHSRVACVDCHIGPGASWAVKSKLDGLRQVWHALRGDYSRPIHAPVHTLRPARETCEECHWPDRFHGNRVIFRRHFLDDEENTGVVNALVLRIGGENPLSKEYEGIHWHVSANTQVRYEALDDKREKIGRIEVVRDGKVVAEYLPPPSDSPLEVREHRVLDCVDCHNRPTHQFDGSPAQAVDWAFGTGLLDRGVPFLRKLALPLLGRVDRPREGVEKEFEAELAAAYDAEHPDKKPDAAALAKAAAGLAELYRRNVFPQMQIGWDTYPTHIGHAGEAADVRGCFRCHDEKHKTADGKALSQDCELCHEMLAQEEKPEELDDQLKALFTAPRR